MSNTSDLPRYKFVIPLLPQGQARPRGRAFRVSRRDNPSQSKIGVSIYSDPKQNTHLEQMRESMRRQWPDEPLSCALKLSLFAIYPRPRSKPKWWLELSLRASLVKTSKPDLSNIVKLVEDAGNGIIWKDDSQIAVYGECAKIYGDSPSYVFIVERLNMPTRENCDAFSNSGKQIFNLSL